MIFGLNLPNYSRLGNRESMIAIAEVAEKLGYSSLWTSDHVLVPSDRPGRHGSVQAKLAITASYAYPVSSAMRSPATSIGTLADQDLR